MRVPRSRARIRKERRGHRAGDTETGHEQDRDRGDSKDRRKSHRNRERHEALESLSQTPQRRREQRRRGESGGEHDRRHAVDRERPCQERARQTQGQR